MNTRRVRLFMFRAMVAGVWLACSGSALVAQELDGSLGEQVFMVPAGGFSEPELEVTVFAPPGPGPFPVILINHGRAPGNAKFQARYRPVLAVREFIQRGYVVMAPMRQGFSKSGGSEISGGCNVYSNGIEQARSVRRALDWAALQPWADVSRIVVMGQSHGGLTTLAYGTEPRPGTRLLINFAGGLRQENCTSWEHNLMRAMGAYGAATRLPSLWFYGDNDSYFQPFVWRGAHERYLEAGARAELVAFGTFGSDSHRMFSSREGLPIWLPRVLQAMASAGLPTELVHKIPEAPDLPAPPASGFAALDDIDSLPLRGERGREGYREWLRAEAPRAFAIQPVKGLWASSWGGRRAIARVLSRCETLAKAPCKLYAVDDAVVWTRE
ncbi:MAG: CocE/NonD family hydrolase [Burkholderiaceae bacterium]